MTEPEARVNGEPILWMGNRFYNYVPHISESSGDPGTEDAAQLTQPGFESYRPQRVETLEQFWRGRAASRDAAAE